MKIKKNGKVLNLTESDLKKIVKKVLTEEEENTLLIYFKIGSSTVTVPLPSSALNGIKPDEEFTFNNKNLDKDTRQHIEDIFPDTIEITVTNLKQMDNNNPPKQYKLPTNSSQENISLSFEVSDEFASEKDKIEKDIKDRLGFYFED